MYKLESTISDDSAKTLTALAVDLRLSPSEVVDRAIQLVATMRGLALTMHGVMKPVDIEEGNIW